MTEKLFLRLQLSFWIDCKLDCIIWIYRSISAPYFLSINLSLTGFRALLILKMMIIRTISSWKTKIEEIIAIMVPRNSKNPAEISKTGINMLARKRYLLIVNNLKVSLLSMKIGFNRLTLKYSTALLVMNLRKSITTTMILPINSFLFIWGAFYV